jgi:hypothetical protein
MTKLKTNKTFIKWIRIKIRNQKNKDWNWNTKNKKEKSVFFLAWERKERGKKETVTGNKPHIIRRHAPHQEKEDMSAHPKI